MAARKFDSEILATGSAIQATLFGIWDFKNPFELIGDAEDEDDEERFEAISEKLEAFRRHARKN